MSSQKNTFAVTMTLLLAFLLAGSIFGYKKATTPTETAAHETAAPTETNSTEAAKTPETSKTEAATGEAPAETAAATTNAGASTGDTAAGEQPAKSAGDAAAGSAKFAAACAACHGTKAEGGMGGLAPKLDKVHGWTLEQFTAAVRELKAPEKPLAAPMMKFTADQVSDAEVANIYAWLKTVN